MSAEKFLQQVALTGLVDDAVLARLRKQLAAGGGTVTAEAVARTLIKGGHLTKSQATKLLAELEAEDQEESPPIKKTLRPTDTIRGRPDQASARSMDEDLGLAPLEGDEAETPPAAAKPAPAKSGPAKSGPTKPSSAKPAPSVDEDLGLAPLGDEEEETPPAAPAKGSPAKPAPARAAEEEEIVMLEHASQSPPSQPAPQPRAGRPKGAAPAREAEVPGPLSAAGGLLPLDAAGGLESLDGLEPLDAVSGLEPISEAGLEPIAGTPAGAAAAPQFKPRRGPASVWDSKLLYVGGGALILICILGFVLYKSLTRGTAAEMLAKADENYAGGSYAQAIGLYEKFLAAYPKDPNVSLARVKIGTAKMWQTVQGGQDKTRALAAAKEILPTIENENAFAQLRAELASILPDIADGFAKTARAKEEIAEAERQVAAAEEAMGLVNNPAYIPTSLRKSIETKLNTITENIDLAKRNINQSKRLAAAVKEIGEAIEAKDTAKAFTIRKDLIREYPALEQNATLNEAVLAITQRERDLVRVEQQPLAAVSEDHPPLAEFRVALSSRHTDGSAGDDKHVISVLARGAVYAVQAATGQVLWRRYVGFDTTHAPQPVAPQAGADLLVVDGRRQELLRLKAADGQLVWRLPIGEPFANPLIYSRRILVATRSGKLLDINLEDGQSARRAVLPMPLTVPPGTSPVRRLYQAGDHSNLYVLDEETLECKEVYYLGHKAGAIQTPPVMVLGHLFLAENSGENSCDLHVLKVDENGQAVKAAMKPLRLGGRLFVTPVVSGPRLVLVTDLGEIRILEVTPNNPKEPVIDAVQRVVASFKSPVTGYAAIEGGRGWVANDRLTKYEVQTSRNQLISGWIKHERDVFLGPPKVLGDYVYYLRRRADSPAYTLAAIQGNEGKLAWEVDLATPAALLDVNLEKKLVHAVSTQAELFEVTADVFKLGQLDQAASAAVGAARTIAYQEAVPLSAGRWALTAPDDRRRLVLYKPDAPSATGRLTISPLKLAAEAKVTAAPVLFLDGLLVGQDNGQIALLDPETGAAKILPFQASVEAGSKIGWQRPAVIADAFVIADNQRKVYRVKVSDQPQPHLSAAAQTALEADVVSPLAAAGDTVYAAVRGAGSDTIISLAAADLALGQEWPLTGRVVWGPETIGGLVLVASDRDGLLCFESGQKQRWVSKLEYGPLVGRPWPQDGDLILASLDGAVWRISGKDGAQLQKTDVGEPLANGPVAFGSRLLLCGADGTLLIVPALTGTAP